MDLAHALVARGAQVHCTDLSPTAPPMLRGASWSALDVCDAQAVRDTVQQIKPDKIYHLAAILSARGESMPVRAYEVNLGGTLHVLEAARSLPNNSW